MPIIYYEETDSAIIVLRERGPDTVGDIMGEDLPAPEPVVLHRDGAGELYEVEIYGGASRRVDLNKLVYERRPAT